MIASVINSHRTTQVYVPLEHTIYRKRYVFVAYRHGTAVQSTMMMIYSYSVCQSICHELVFCSTDLINRHVNQIMHGSLKLHGSLGAQVFICQNLGEIPMESLSVEVPNACWVAKID